MKVESTEGSKFFVFYFGMDHQQVLVQDFTGKYYHFILSR